MALSAVLDRADSLHYLLAGTVFSICFTEEIDNLLREEKAGVIQKLQETVVPGVCAMDVQ